MARQYFDLEELYKALSEDHSLMKSEAKKSANPGKPGAKAFYLKHAFALRKGEEHKSLPIKISGVTYTGTADATSEASFMVKNGWVSNKRKFFISQSANPTLYKFVELVQEIRNKHIKDGVANGSLPSLAWDVEDHELKTICRTHYSKQHPDEKRRKAPYVDSEGQPDPRVPITFDFSPYPKEFDQRAGKPKTTMKDFKTAAIVKGKLQFDLARVGGVLINGENVHKFLTPGSDVKIGYVMIETNKSAQGVHTNLFAQSLVIDSNEDYGNDDDGFDDPNLLESVQKMNMEQSPKEGQDPEEEAQKKQPAPETKKDEKEKNQSVNDVLGEL